MHFVIAWLLWNSLIWKDYSNITITVIYLTVLTLEHSPGVSGVWWEAGWCRSSCDRVRRHYTGNGRFHRAAIVEWRWSHSSHTHVPPSPPHPTSLHGPTQTFLISTGHGSSVTLFFATFSILFLIYFRIIQKFLMKVTEIKVLGSFHPVGIKIIKLIYI